MREIKFRVWDKEFAKWWAEEFLHLQMDGKHIKGSLCWSHPAPCATLDCDLPEESIVIEQYTGLKDDSGKEIYEGDILEAAHLPPFEMSDSIIGVVRWNDEEASFELHTKERLGQYCLNDIDKRIVGNVHENPELPS